MKKVVMIFLSIMILLSFSIKVYAKDTFKSINKYEEENLEYILKSYDKNNKIDGIVTTGTYKIKKIESKEKDDSNIIVIKYNSDGKELWTYKYGKSGEDKLYYFNYSYDENNKIDGYIITVNETKEEKEEKGISPLFIKIDLDGKQISETKLELPANTNIKKVIETKNDSIINGYIVVGETITNNETNGFIAKYNLNLEKLMQKEYHEEGYSTCIEDIINLNNEETYKAIIQYKIAENITNKLVSIDSEYNISQTIKEDFTSIDKPRLLSCKEGYILYGYNDEIKLKNNKSTSYYIIKYNALNAEEWESIGNVPVENEDNIEIQEITEENNLNYFVMYTNDNDKSIEITKVNSLGEIVEKIKKISNDYYSFENFYIENDTLYFVGQVNCPDDDNCDYDMKALLLISTEDKVIEVEQEDNMAIFIILGTIFIFSILLYILRRKQKMALKQ